MIKLPHCPRALTLVAALASPAILAQEQSQTGNIAQEWQYIFGFAALVAGAGIVWAFLAGLHRWWLTTSPLKSVTYLIPQAQYKLAQFGERAPSSERWPTHLELDPGWEYIVMFRIVPRKEIIVDDAVFDFGAAIEDVGSKNPFYVKTMTRVDGRIHRQDWWGHWHNDNPSNVYKAGDQWVTGHRVRTHGSFAGSIVLTFRIRGHPKSYIRHLSLTVREGGHDDLLFLRQPIPVAGTAD